MRAEESTIRRRPPKQREPQGGGERMRRCGWGRDGAKRVGGGWRADLLGLRALLALATLAFPFSLRGPLPAVRFLALHRSFLGLNVHRMFVEPLSDFLACSSCNIVIKRIEEKQDVIQAVVTGIEELEFAANFF